MSSFTDAVHNPSLSADGSKLTVQFYTKSRKLVTSVFDLDTVLGNSSGKFEWGKQSYSRSARNTKIRSQDRKNSSRSYTILSAELHSLDGSWPKAQVILDHHIRLSEDGDRLVPYKVDVMAGFSDQCTNIRLERETRDSGRPALLLKVDFHDDSGAAVPLKPFDIDTVLGNYNGKPIWKAGGGISGSTNDASITFRDEYSTSDSNGKSEAVRRTILHAELLLPDKSWLTATIDLDEHIQLLHHEHADQIEHKEDCWELAPYKLPRSRTLVLCFDGTTNQFDDTNTNLVHLMKVLQKTDPVAQQVYYQTGIGTYAPPGLWTSIGLWVAKTLDEAFAWFLDQHVMAGYRYIAQSYKSGDKISIFGFSRGAHTARAVAGMLDVIGILPAENLEHIPFAYKLYKHSTTKKGKLLAEGFKATFCETAEIHFLGVWDTVNSTGMLYPRTLPHTDHNDCVKFFRHALSLDEHRVKFLPSVVNAGPDDTDDTKGVPPNVKEVWFPGDHCDVGGGNEQDKQPDGETDKPALANIPLRWMIKEAIACDASILFKANASSRINLVVDSQGIVQDTCAEDDRADIEAYQRSLQDLRANRHDAFIDSKLLKKVMWWLIEWMPLRVYVPREGPSDGLGKKATEWRLNRGKGREITLKGERPVRIHVSAKHLLYPESYLQDSSSPSSNARYSSSTEQPLVNGPASSPSAKKPNAYVPKARFGSDRVDLKAIVDDAERQHLVHWED